MFLDHLFYCHKGDLEKCSLNNIINHHDFQYRNKWVYLEKY